MHKIFGKRFIGVREPVWHGLGTIVEKAPTAQEALELAEINFTYETSPVFFEAPDGTRTPVDNRLAVLRSPTADDDQWRPVGFVSNQYEFIQNQDLAAGLDAIAKETGWTFETAGALKHGASIFMTLKTGDTRIAGEAYNGYILVTDAKNTGEALQIAYVPVRVVCQNTLTAAIGSAKQTIKVRHNAHIANEYKFWTDAIPQIHKHQEAMHEQLEAAAQVKLSQELMRDYMAVVYPLPEKTFKHQVLDDLNLDAKSQEASMAYWTDRALAMRDAATTLYERFNDSDEQGGDSNNSNNAGTVYAALQAVTELEDWGGSARDAGNSVLFGSRAKAKRRAWDAATTLL